MKLDNIILVLVLVLVILLKICERHVNIIAILC